jgi:hypothetical protein
MEITVQIMKNLNFLNVSEDGYPCKGRDNMTLLRQASNGGAKFRGRGRGERRYRLYKREDSL